MKGIPSAIVISFNWPTVSSASCSDSMTQGPAMRNSGRSRPTSKPQSFMRSPAWRDRGGGCVDRTRSGARPSRRHPFGEARRFAHRLLLARRADEAHEQRMAIARRRGEFRMELPGDEPWMVRQFDHLDEQVVHRLAGDDEAEVLELLPI